MKKTISFLVLMGILINFSTAQKKFNVKLGTDLVSAYIWRGTYNAGASFQPVIETKLAGFTLGTWGSTDFVGESKKEVDLYLKYSIKGFTIGVTDYWWEGEGKFNYFDYKKGTTTHRWEGNISYQLPIEKFPLIISWNTMFAGNDYNAKGKRAFSTYIELDYPFSIGSINMNAIIGATPWYSPSILPSENKSFSVCNIAISALKEFKLSNKITLPIFTRLTFNPAIQDIYLVFGINFTFSN